MRGGLPVRLNIYIISLFLDGSVEDTPGFGIGSVQPAPRERPPTMIGRRIECAGRVLSHINSIPISPINSVPRLLGWRQPILVHETKYEAEDIK